MKPKSNYMPPEQFQLLLDNVKLLQLKKTSPMKIEDIKMLFKIARYCGLRITEACNLEREDFDLEAREVSLGTTKTNKNDQASIPKHFLEDLGEYLFDKTGKLFHTNRHTVHYWLKVLGEKLNIACLTTPQSETGEKTKCHIFRKSIGKDMINQKMPINVVMGKLRHKDLATTTQYLKLGIEDIKLAEEDLKI